MAKRLKAQSLRTEWVGLAAVGLLILLAAPIALAAQEVSTSFFGVPAFYFYMVIAAPVLTVLVVYWTTRLLNKIERYNPEYENE